MNTVSGTNSQELFVHVVLFTLALSGEKNVLAVYRFCTAARAHKPGLSD